MREGARAGSAMPAAPTTICLGSLRAPSAAAALSWLRREKAQSSATARTRRQWVPAELSAKLSKLRVRAATVP